MQTETPHARQGFTIANALRDFIIIRREERKGWLPRVSYLTVMPAAAPVWGDDRGKAICLLKPAAVDLVRLWRQEWGKSDGILAIDFHVERFSTSQQVLAGAEVDIGQHCTADLIAEVLAAATVLDPRELIAYIRALRRSLTRVPA